MNFEQIKDELSGIATKTGLEQLTGKLVDFATTTGFKLVAVIALVIVSLKAIKWIKKWIKTSPKLNKIDTSLRSFAVSFISVLLYSILFVTVLMILGVPATSFVALLTTCAAAIGLALQGSLANFAGGVVILLMRPYKLGDYVQIGGEEGNVEKIELFYTYLSTSDNKVVVIPNANASNDTIVNYCKNNTRRVDIVFQIAYENDFEQAKQIITKCAEETGYHYKQVSN